MSKLCKQCGVTNAEDSRFCESCGESIQQPEVTAECNLEFKTATASTGSLHGLHDDRGHECMFDDKLLKPTVLENVRKLVEDKTRFEPSQIQPVSILENFQPYEVSVFHVLDAKTESVAINGHFVRSEQDKKTFDPVLDASNEVAIQLRQAVTILETVLAKSSTKCDQITPGLLLRHPHKHWYLQNCHGCGGHGKNSCGGCSGKGTVTCYQCYGMRTVTCRHCLNGYVSCSSCHGRGVVPRQVSYVVYINGSYQTQYRTEYFNCNSCSGSGKTRCYICHGDGKVDCSTCMASGSLTCSSCDGSGEVVCKPCVGSGAVGQAAWVDVHASQEFSHNLPEGTPQDVMEIVEKEGTHGLPSISEHFEFTSAAIDNHDTPGNVTAIYRGEFRVVRQEVLCDGESAHLIAYGNDLRWWTLDGIIERLLQADLAALSNAIVQSANEGIFSSRIDLILANLKHVVASEINVDIVEAVLANKDIQEHRGAASEEYAKHAKHSIQVALRTVYVREAKGFAWKTALAGLFCGIAVWIFEGAMWVAPSVIATLIVGLLLHKKSIRNLLIKTCGTPECAKRAMEVTSKGPGGREAALLVSIPSVALAVTLSLGLPAQSPFDNKGAFYYKSHQNSGQDAQSQKDRKAPVSTPAPVAAPVMPPASAPAATPVVQPTTTVASPASVQAAPVPAPVTPTVAQSAPTQSQQTPAAKPSSKLKMQVPKKQETKDDVKLLNAIDQYMDKQSQGK